MKRKDYQKPTMRVVKLRQRAQLLAGSVEAEVSAQREGYQRGRSSGSGEGEEIWQ